jgi:dCTP deaminase
MRVGNFPLQGYMLKEKVFLLLYLPDSQPGGFVNILLKKNGHDFLFRGYFAPVRIKSKKSKSKIRMILSDKRILEEIEKGTIKIEPYQRECLGSNSYDVHLGKMLATYREHILDAKKHNEIESFEIPEDGFVLYPHIFYLGVTMEYTETHAHVPFLEGKSSTGRLGIDIHATAGKGDVGFCGNWTLEISVKQPVKVYAGMPVGQLIYFPVEGEIEVKYNQKANAKYSGQPNRPVESMMWKNKF